MKKNEELIKLLNLQKIGDKKFQSVSSTQEVGRVYGGENIALAIAAAASLVDPEHFCNSLKVDFLSRFNSTFPTVFDVEVLPTGFSYEHFHVKIMQNEKLCAFATILFKKLGQSLEYLPEMPEVPAPESLKPIEVLFEKIFSKIPLKQRFNFVDFDLFEVRFTSERNSFFFKEATSEPINMWVRFKGDIDPNNFVLHQQILAYVSDVILLYTVLRALGFTLLTPKAHIYSLDHTMWFHRPFRVDEWILYSTQACNASNKMGLAQGRFFSQDGKLLASTAQQGVIEN